MQDQINLFAVSDSSSLLEGLEKLPLNENGISIYSSTCNFHLPHLFYNSAPMVKSSVLFIDNLSISNKTIINCLEKNKIILNNNGINTIVYTGSDSKKYLNTLLDLNVNGILLNEETPLKDFLIHNFYHEQYSEQVRLNYSNTGKKFIDTIKSVCCELNYYDGAILSLIQKRNWGKASANLNSLNTESGLVVNKAIIIKPTEYVNNLLFNAEEIIRKLTTIEKILLIKMAEGKENKQIAEELFKSTRTIDTHKTNMKTKYGFRTIQQLYLFAYKYAEKIKESL